MAPKKKARTGQGADATSGVAVDSIPNDVGERLRGEDIPPATTLPDSTTPTQTTPIPTPTEGATIPPPTPASGPGVSDGDLRGAIQMLAPIVDSQAQRSNVAPASSSQQGDSTSSRVNSFFQLDPPVFTGILIVQSYNVYALIDPGFTLSYVTPYVAMEFGIEPEQLHEPFFVSTPVGESMVVAMVYRDCVVTVHGWDTMDDCIELGMVDFDVILVMDWLYSCFAKLD
ncbi:uncharacterized protein [Nicotiana tomentosiformis]|uniref:uncharacterized protein n=1 Tax=Nicotiana tomentosiformis TaxID=4098 RepID=UPI00388C3AFE